MERLTERDAYWLGEEFWTSAREPDDEEIDSIYITLKDYEDAEEQGLLFRLPCKVGDKAYYLHRVYLTNAGVYINEIDEVEVDSFVLNINLFVNVSYYIGSDVFRMTLTPYKTLFFTKEEAEAALEKMKGEEHENNEM